MTYKPTCVELFAGAGGLALGLKQAGFTAVFANDIDPDGCASFKLNHPETEVVCGDIRDIDFCDVKNRLAPGGIDLVAGGPPCQGFSTVGSKNESDPRNSLFYEFTRAVSELSPKCILFENVSGFKRMYHGRAFDALVTELSDLGYSCVHGVLNASDYGLPQHRNRTVVLGWKSDSTPIQLPVPSHGVGLGLFNLQRSAICLLFLLGMLNSSTRQNRRMSTSKSCAMVSRILQNTTPQSMGIKCKKFYLLSPKGDL